MSSKRSLEVILLFAILFANCYRVHGRPQDKQNVLEQNRQAELTKESKIGETKVYGLIHNDSEGKEAKQEKEDFDSKVLTVLESVQQKIINLWNPGAVIDKTTAEDWKKNPIEDYQALRQGIVNAVDAIAKQINSVLDKPRKLTTKINKSITKSLNAIGNKLVGLE
ncbi:uncharacterized protein LOC128736396 [Sabethes cyaneus]|uniref:uncharacterized protein LOC128736396 n=1 Tax=Sabethes cyaneus TaxID=53552 RepID=UPI00237D673F|nr:uncharacterized protein LOC128736396 [Sabethes cyaneus]